MTKLFAPLRGKHRPHRMHEINATALDGRREGSTLAVGDIYRHLVLAPACCSTKAKYQLGPCNDKVKTERSPDRTLLSNANERMAWCSLSTRRLANLLYSANPRNSQACQYLGVNVCIGKGPHTNTFSEHFWLPRAPLRLLIAIKCLRFAFPEAFKPNNKSISNQLRFWYRLRDNFCSIFDLGSGPF